jgi:hypothetical protein
MYSKAFRGLMIQKMTDFVGPSPEMGWGIILIWQIGRL